ncbi:GNAT family N-acetyltransferase [Streptomyces sp. NPDC020719]|uniref:GNAT family N-acetyltransferase n=1 Tax=unclassified Streptomyces TaxID=2593676 RepID=UPI0034093A3D
MLIRPAPRAAVLLDTASHDDVAALRHLYFTVYGSVYPLPVGTDPAAMAAAVDDPGTRWHVARHAVTGQVIGSAVLRGDRAARIGKVEALAVHPEHAGAGIGRALLSELCEAAVGPGGELDSVYATARCVSPAPQRALLRHGFRPAGLLPAAVQVCGRESLALLVRHRDGVLDRRAPLGELPGQIVSLLDAATSAGIAFDGVRPGPDTPAVRPGQAAEPMEVVQEPHFVRRHYARTARRAPAGLPWGEPNALLAPVDGRFETYAVIDRTSGCGMLLDTEPHDPAADAALGDVVQAMADRGALYVEAVLPLADRPRLDLYLAHGFVPTGVYPAMRFDGERWHDHVFLSHGASRPDFRALDVDEHFTRYLQHYRRMWTATYLSTFPEDSQR